MAIRRRLQDGNAAGHHPRSVESFSLASFHYSLQEIENEKKAEYRMPFYGADISPVRHLSFDRR
jgi:hypothetical protein